MVHAANDAYKFGMSFDEANIVNYILPYKRHIDLDTDAETEFDSDPEIDYMNDESYSELDSHFDNAAIESNPDEIFETEEIIDDFCEDKTFVEVVSENGTVKKNRKSSLVWILSEKGSRVSNDRLKRVTSLRTSSRRTKRARQTNDK